MAQKDREYFIGKLKELIEEANEAGYAIQPIQQLNLGVFKKDIKK